MRGPSKEKPLELDDPLDEVSRRSTVPPAYDADQRAKDLDADPPSRRPTSPPAPIYPLLRDSCASIHAGPALEDDWEPEVAVDLDDLDGAHGEVELAAARVPYLALTATELEFVHLDEEVTALIGAIDGVLSVRGLAETLAMPVGRAAALVERLLARGVLRSR